MTITKSLIFTTRFFKAWNFLPQRHTKNHEEFMFIKMLLATVLFGSCSAFAQSPASNVEAITRKLASAEEAKKVADFIAARFSEAGLKVLAGASPNVAGLVEGTTRKDEFVIVSAHYDGRGAMDNAAGVAVMIEIARVLAKTPPQRSVLFIAFDGGERNNSGAKLYAERPLVPLGKTAAAINLVGFGAGFGDQLHDTLFVVGAEYSPQIAAAITKHKRGETASLAMLGDDVTRFAGAEHLHFKLGQLPTITITNGLHYSYHTEADVAGRINFAALNKHPATLAKVIAELANSPEKIEHTTQPSYDVDEAAEWHRLLSALRENVLKTPDNNAGQAHIDDVLLELKRFKGRAVQEPKAREAVILRAASICFYIVK